MIAARGTASQEDYVPGTRVACGGALLGHPSFRWSHIWRAPLHDFPIRDEIFYQYMPLRSDMDVLEIGPGSGFTAFCLAGLVCSSTLVDLSEDSVNELRQQLGHLSNLHFVQADVSRPGLLVQSGMHFDAAFALDVLEYVVNPAMCLSNIASVLRPGGLLFLTFPNVPPSRGDGVTWFRSISEIEGLLREAGFSRWEVFAVRPRPYAAAVHSLLHDWPLEIYRRLRRGNPNGYPQTYEATWAFQHRRQLGRYKVLPHSWWAVINLFLRLRGNVFEAESLNGQLFPRQLVIRAWR